MPDDEGLREELAAALLAHYRSVFGEWRGWNLIDGFADALLPVVERYGRKCAADALRQAAAAPYVWTTDGPAIPRYELERRAEALGRTEAET